LPEPNRSRPSNNIGNIADVPRKYVPAANIDEPMRHNSENKNTPTGIHNTKHKDASQISYWI